MAWDVHAALLSAYSAQVNSQSCVDNMLLNVSVIVCAGGRVPTARGAHEALVTALADQASWATRAASAKELLAAMLASRRSAAELAKQHDIRYGEELRRLFARMSRLARTVRRAGGHPN